MNAITIKNLKKQYANGTEALKGIDLQVEIGDFFALLGANGAGKTTIIGIITCLVNKSSGEVQVFDFDINKQPVEAKKMIGVVPQEFNFNIFEKVIDILVSQAGYYGIPRSKAILRAEIILKDLELWDKKDAVSRTLSGGMKRRLMIARALMHEPKLLILDEPTAGVDVELRHGMWRYLEKLNNEGTTILLTTHYLEEVEQLCRNVAIIKQGQIIKHDTVKNMVNSLEKQTYVVNVIKFTKNKVANYDLRILDENTLEVDLGLSQNLTDFITVLNENGMVVKDIRSKGNRMEQLFLNILKDK